MRVPSEPADKSPTHFEFKTVDASANPYLVGAILAAGLDGVRRRLDPGEILMDTKKGNPPQRGKFSFDTCEKARRWTDASGTEPR